MKRVFDICIALIAFCFFLIPALLIAVLIKLYSKGPILYWSERIGRGNKIFKMPKFRTMVVGTPVVASHLLQNTSNHITPIGKFLRKTSMDELPQLISILKGDMSFVGPRPALYNQLDLITLRITYDIDKLLPGLTGWAQINGRDELIISEKVALDLEYLQRRSFFFDLKIIFLTFAKVIFRDDISH